MSEERLALFVPSRPLLVAGRLRVHMEQRGFLLAAPAAPAAPTGFSIVIRPDGAGCWLHSDVVDAVPSELGQLLSQELRCEVTTVGSAGDVRAYEIARAGNVVEKLAANGDQVLDSKDSPHAAAVEAGRSLDTVWPPEWSAALTLPFADARAVRRAVTLAFLPKRGQGDEVIEIDPTLDCPICGSAMKTVEGPHGRFFGCVRFPECRGRLTAKQAAASRAGGKK